MKQNRKKHQEISAKKAQKKQVNKNVFRAALAVVALTSVVGLLAHTGTKNIVNEINNSNFIPKNVHSVEYSTGYLLFQDGNNQLDIDKYISEICKKGKKEGFSKEKIGIYCNYKYGTDYGLIEGKADGLITKLSASFGYNNELSEGRGAR